MQENNEPLAWVWQNVGRSAKLSINNSIWHLCIFQADVFQMPPLRQDLNH